MINFLFCHQDRLLIDELNERLNLKEWHDEGKFIPISEETNLIRFLKENKRIVLFITDNFLKDATCLTGKPINLIDSIKSREDIKIVKHKVDYTRVSDIIAYINYWQDQYLDLRRNRNQIEIQESELLKARKISSEIGEFLRILRQLDSWELEEVNMELLKKMFPGLIFIKSNEKLEFDSELHPLSKGKSDSLDTLLNLRENIIKIIDHPEANLSHEEILLNIQKLKDEIDIIKGKAGKGKLEGDFSFSLKSILEYLKISVKVETLEELIAIIIEKIKDKDYQIASLSREIKSIKKISNDCLELKDVLISRFGLSKSVKNYELLNEIDQLLTEVGKKRELKELIEIWIDDIARAETGKVIKRVLDFCRKNNLQEAIGEVIQISVRWNSLYKMKIQGTINNDEYTLQLNKINSSFIQLIFNLDK